MAASNFLYQEDFDLWAADFSIPLYPLDETTGEEDENAVPVDYLFDDYGYDRAAAKVDELNKTLKFYKLQLNAGYYAGTQICVDDSEVPDEWYFNRYPRDVFAEYGVNSYILRRMLKAERRRINSEILPLFKEYGFDKYGISAHFSNGETWYTKVA